MLARDVPSTMRPPQVRSVVLVRGIAIMSWIHVASIFFFLTTGGLLFAAERLRGTPMSRYAAMSSLGSIVIAGVLFCMDVPNMGPLMDTWEVAKGLKKEKVHQEGE